MVSRELVKQLGLDISEAESQFLLSTEGQNELPASSRGLISVLAERIQLLINSSLDQEWPFLPPDILPDWLTAANRTIPSVSERQILLKCLLLALEEEDYGLASALAFVLDRFMYWYGNAKFILNVVSLIESRSPTTPVAPQLIIRRARVMKDTGDLHGAMRVLNEVHKMGFNVQGGDVNVVSGVPEGCWKYKTKDQYDTVCAARLQIEGQILYNLGIEITNKINSFIPPVCIEHYQRLLWIHSKDHRYPVHYCSAGTCRCQCFLEAHYHLNHYSGHYRKCWPGVRNWDLHEARNSGRYRKC